jgi:hypothetical protein
MQYLEEDIIALRKQVASLKREVEIVRGVQTVDRQKMASQFGDLSRRFEAEQKDTTLHIKEIYVKIGHVLDLVWPLVDKNFPGFQKTMSKIDAILEKGGRGRDRKKDL